MAIIGGIRGTAHVLIGSIAVVIGLPALSAGQASCPFDLVPAVADSVFNDSDWTSTFVINGGTPSWTLDFGAQVNDSEELDPVTAHYIDPVDPPVRYVRFSRNGDADPDAFALVSTVLERTLVPSTGAIDYIQFEYDNFGSNQPIAPLIVQDGTVFLGSKHTALRTLGWHYVSPGCLRETDFDHVFGSLPGNPDFSQPFQVGYSLEWVTDQRFALRDHLIDNFILSTDQEVTVVAVTGENRAPFAVNDVRVLEVETDGVVDDLIYPLGNDVDPDGDTLSVVGFTQPSHGSVVPVETNPITQAPSFRYTADLPQVDGPSFDGFGYTISDGSIEATGAITIIFDYACWLLGIGPGAAGKALSTQEEFDLDLIRRFRDEVMSVTSDGSRFVDYYYETAPEILSILVIDRPELSGQAISMVVALQPVIRNHLDGDGSAVIEQSQVDAVAAFFDSLSAAGSPQLKRLIADELGRLEDLQTYVGRDVASVLDDVMGAPTSTASDTERPQTEGFRLESSFPNPFSGSIRIVLSVKQATDVSVAVYDVAGRRVRMLADRARAQGAVSLTWDGRDRSGNLLPSGVYFVSATDTRGGSVTSSTLVLAR